LVGSDNEGRGPGIIPSPPFFLFSIFSLAWSSDCLDLAASALASPRTAAPRSPALLHQFFQASTRLCAPIFSVPASLSKDPPGNAPRPSLLARSANHYTRFTTRPNFTRWSSSHLPVSETIVLPALLHFPTLSSEVPPTSTPAVACRLFSTPELYFPFSSVLLIFSTPDHLVG